MMPRSRSWRLVFALLWTTNLLGATTIPLAASATAARPRSISYSGSKAARWSTIDSARCSGPLIPTVIHCVSPPTESSIFLPLRALLKVIRSTARFFRRAR